MIYTARGVGVTKTDCRRQWAGVAILKQIYFVVSVDICEPARDRAVARVLRGKERPFSEVPKEYWGEINVFF